MTNTVRDTLALTPEQLGPHGVTVPFASTSEVPPLDEPIGQRDALDALAFGLEVRGPGFGVYVAGENGTGRSTAVHALLGRLASGCPAPRDWVYVHNFDAPDQPTALALPPGHATDIARAVDAFVRDAGTAIRQTLDSEDHDRRRRAALDACAVSRRAVFDELGASAKEHGFRVDVAPGRVTSTPLVGGEPITEDLFKAMSDEARADLAQRTERFDFPLGAAVRRLREVEGDEEERRRAFDRDAARAAAEALLVEPRRRYPELPALLSHLARIADDLASRFAAPALPVEGDGEGEDDGDGDGEGSDDDAGRSVTVETFGGPDASDRARYRVNVLIDHGAAGGAPVVVERHPTPENLAGRVDYRMTSSGLVADFLQIRAGALHRANGGFLVLRAADLLQTESAWDVLKRALLGPEISLEAGERGAKLPATALRPAPIPLDVKVVLIGTQALYQMLFELDPEFRELFKVKVEFAPDVPWTDEAGRLCAAFLSGCVRDRGLRPLDGGAIARTIEHAARLAGDQQRLSTRLGELADLATEASFWAGKADRAQVTRADVDRALHARRDRSGLLERRIREQMSRGTILVETAGQQVGQVNGLAVLDVGDSRFALPARITATVYPGRGTLLSVDGAVELSGPLHDKAVLTLRGYLARTYGRGGPLCLAATLAFEQSYDAIEGDSASLAELLALLSALANVPLDQGVAVTGAVDQRGQVEPVGEVTRKVEGYFAACSAAGLTGAQGVVVPAANRVHLVLDEEVVEAVRAGRFHVWAASTVDEALALLCGREAGAPTAEGDYPDGSVHGLAVAQLRRFGSQLSALHVGAP
jgi:predicted ATP-dependent protease